MFELPSEEHASAIVERAFGRHFELGSRMLEALTAVLSSTNSTELGVPMPVAVAALGLMGKTIKLARAVHLLCRTGLSDESAPLVRSMLETYAHAQFVSRGDKEKNARRMLAMDVLNKALGQERPVPPGSVGRAVERAPQAARQFREDAARWVPDSAELKELEGLAQRYRQWTGLGISQMLEKLSEFDEGDPPFRGLYGALSSSTHGGDISRYVDEAAGRYTADLQPKFVWVGAMVSHANDLCLLVARSVSKFAPIYSAISIQPIEAMKKAWDALPMYAFQNDREIILCDVFVNPVGRLEVPEAST